MMLAIEFNDNEVSEPSVVTGEQSRSRGVGDRQCNKE